MTTLANTLKRFLMKRVFIKTYGCQMNERDSELVEHDLVKNGYELASNEEGADIVVLNTCSVREQAEQKAIGKANHIISKIFIDIAGKIKESFH